MTQLATSRGSWRVNSWARRLVLDGPEAALMAFGFGHIGTQNVSLGLRRDMLLVLEMIGVGSVPLELLTLVKLSWNFDIYSG